MRLHIPYTFTAEQHGVTSYKRPEFAGLSFLPLLLQELWLWRPGLGGACLQGTLVAAARRHSGLCLVRWASGAASSWAGVGRRLGFALGKNRVTKLKKSAHLSH